MMFITISILLCLTSGILTSTFYGGPTDTGPDSGFVSSSVAFGPVLLQSSAYSRPKLGQVPSVNVGYAQIEQQPRPVPYSIEGPTYQNGGNANSISPKNKVDESNPVVWTNDGGLRGFTMKTIQDKPVYAFQGIPFATPPVGKLRFQPPVRNSRWTGVRDAIAESPTCLQNDFIRQYLTLGTEDCLYLNVYTPKVPEFGEVLNLPVMVFIHGGAFFFGSSNLYGPKYLLDENVILVSMNYRLGPLGFFTTGDKIVPGNNGLKDQTLALQWVQENIHAFGGDSDKVTIFGESAGAGSVQLHMVSPLSRGLFHAGISQSGCAFCKWSVLENAVQVGKDFAKTFNCSTRSSREMTDCLAKIDGEELVKGQLKFLKWLMFPVVIFAPVIEPKHRGAFLDEYPGSVYKRGAAAQVPWLTGYNALEGGINIATILTSPTHAEEVNSDWNRVGPIILEMEEQSNKVDLVRKIRSHYMQDREVSFENRVNASNMFSDRYLNICGMTAIRTHARLNSQPVYAYYFNYAQSYGVVQLLGQDPQAWGPTHLDELLYMMNNTLYYPDLKKDDEEYHVSRIVTNLWTNFAKTGKPCLTYNTEGAMTDVWEPVNPNGDRLRFLDIGTDVKMIEDPYEDRVNFWSTLNV